MGAYPFGVAEATGSSVRERASRGLSLAGLIAGPAVMLVWLVTSHVVTLNAWSPEANRLFAILLLTLIWWLTEPIPLAATGLLAVVLAVVLRVHPGERPLEFILAQFAAPVVFFLLGGLFLAAAMTRYRLDYRFALWTLSRRWVTARPANVLLALGLATGGMSMWISNTAATAMVCPVALGMIAVLAKGGGAGLVTGRYAVAMLLMVGFSATVGGLATPIGTMPNIVCIGYLRSLLDVDIDFFTWMALGLPLSLAIFAGLLLWLSCWTPKTPIDLGSLEEAVADQRRELGRMGRGEINTLIVFVTLVVLWLTPSVAQITLGIDHPLTGQLKARLPAPVVAMMAPVMLFLMPVDWRTRTFTLRPADFGQIDWATLLMFGSGLSLGALIQSTGLGAAAGEAILGGTGLTHVWVITVLTTGGAVLLSNLISNTAVAVMIIPMVVTMCEATGVMPLWPAVGAAFGASFGSCLPVSTPPNAIVYGSGRVSVRQMVVGGIVLDIIAAVVIWCGVRTAASLGWLDTAASHLF